MLLNRARSVAAEHAKLSAQNAETYDVNTAKKIGELVSVTAALRAWDDAQNVRRIKLSIRLNNEIPCSYFSAKSVTELNALLRDPSSDDEIKSLAADDVRSTASSLAKLTSTLKHSLVPSHPFAALPCLVEIHPGAGGSEASLFAATILRMYQAFCTQKGWRAELVKYDADDSAPSGEVGLTEAVLEILRPGSYDILRSEAGVHRVQRVPATERKGRTHTSAVSVLVLPSLPTPRSGGGEDSALNADDPSSDYYINPGDVRAETMRARGAGGQHVNKTDSAVRLLHIPTGIVVTMQDSRSQHKNREKAWQILRAKLAQKRREEREEELIQLRRNLMGGVAVMGRGDKVRTYNFSQNRVTDHRCGSESNDLEGVLEGGESLEKIMGDVKEWMQEIEVAGLAADEESRFSRSGKET